MAEVTIKASEDGPFLVKGPVKVVDADTHLTEAHDLWVKRAPAAYKDRVPRVEEVDGRPTWLVDGTTLGFAGGGGVIDREGEKFPFAESMIVWGISSRPACSFTYRASRKTSVLKTSFSSAKPPAMSPYSVA